MLVRIIGGHGGVSPGFRATSYLIDGKLLLDAGSVASGIQIEEQSNIDHILISHAHLDHISDLAFLADNCFGMKGKPFEIYANTPVKNAIMTHLLNDVIWPDFTTLPTKENPTLRIHDVKPLMQLVLGDYRIMPIPVNHSTGALGFIIERKNASVVFTQDTGPTDEIWKYAHEVKNLKAIFTEVSFPNSMEKVATASQHHTPATMKEEIKKMPKDVPIFLGHLKPNFQSQLFKEIAEIGDERITILGSGDTSYVF
ncbi:3',5'-cyclic-nucleotide phosphodiesterase [Bacteriovorax sp. PP10]|uniref:3',5'-cyclic-nucleotide phosphodiesterase n=1 Tax=Bacteriovorax antarcticus TaxID=3088717 RepID=A0ABU5W2Y0_9BACT|nr:3',5'-cyclic-nucleotide phosphodiesterase [Bacteriovorax sp. PP10]MEA9358595.1 3',5'-cyclic-nucleotide phosphodiesterase [Bacteriovorax sp. PP10]